MATEKEKYSAVVAAGAGESGAIRRQTKYKGELTMKIIDEPHTCYGAFRYVGTRERERAQTHACVARRGGVPPFSPPWGPRC